MIISNCIDEIKPENPSNLSATTLEERELLMSVAKLLYKSKSVRKIITMLDSLSNSLYCIRHSIPPEVMWNNSDLSNTEILGKHNKYHI